MAQKLLGSIKKKMRKNKLIMCGTMAFLLLVIILIIYSHVRDSGNTTIINQNPTPTKVNWSLSYLHPSNINLVFSSASSSPFPIAFHSGLRTSVQRNPQTNLSINALLFPFHRFFSHTDESSPPLHPREAQNPTHLYTWSFLSSRTKALY